MDWSNVAGSGSGCNNDTNVENDCSLFLQRFDNDSISSYKVQTRKWLQNILDINEAEIECSAVQFPGEGNWSF